jgi:hypothetical protein
MIGLGSRVEGQATRNRRDPIVMRAVASYIRRHHLALLALFVALGGTAYAATEIRSRDIKNSTIVSKDVKNGTLTGSDVKDDRLTGADIDEATLEVSRVVNRARGSSTVALNAGLTNYPLESGATWTQQPTESDTVAGNVTFNFPAACNASIAQALVTVDGGASPATSGIAFFPPGGGDVTVPLGGGLILLGGGTDLTENGAPTTHTLTAQAIGNCTPGPGVITIKGLKANVVGNR